jgi:hypothetical protein
VRKSSPARPPGPVSSTGDGGERAAAAGRQRDGRPAGLGRTGARAPADRGHNAPLPDPDRLRAAPGQRRRRRPRTAFLIGAAPEVTSLTAATRRHIEDYKPWLAARPGQNKPALTTATIAHRLGTLRMFFVRLDEWGWDQAPPRVPMFPGDLPRQDHPLPNAPGDGAAAKLLRAAQNDRRLLVRVTVETLLNPHDGITLDQKGYDRWRLFYMNGRKRTHAMLEAGVHRTVVIRWRAPRRH